MLEFEANEDFFKSIKPFIESKLIIEDNDYYSLNCDLIVKKGDCVIFKAEEENEIKKKEKQEIDRTYPVDGTIVKTVKDNKSIAHKNLGDKLVKYEIKEGGNNMYINQKLEDENGDEKWDQFELNKKMYNVKSTYDENLYTTKLDKSNITEEDKRYADKIYNEIINSSKDEKNIHIIIPLFYFIFHQFIPQIFLNFYIFFMNI